MSEYDAGGRPGKVEIRATDGDPPAKTTTYDYETGDEGLLKAIHRPDGDITFDYDDWGCLTAVGDGEGMYGTTFSPYGVPLAQTTAYTGLGTKTQGYDYTDAGSRAKLTLPDGRVIVPTYNGAGQVTRIDLGPDGGTPTRSVAYQYDSAGRVTTMSAGYRTDGMRAWKDSGAGKQYYLYDGETLLAEMNAAGALTDVNLWGPDGLACHGGTFYLYDPLGNVVHRLNTSGNVLSSEIYDAWGVLLDAIEPSTGNAYDFGDDPYGYKGQYGYYTDRETGLILCTHRYYDPTLGRLLTRDQIGYEGD